MPALVLQEDPRALARLVEAFGLYRAEKVVGSAALSAFPKIARYIHPARRKGLLALWHWKSNRTTP